MMKRVAIVLLLAAASAGCSQTENYKDQAEWFIDNNRKVEERVGHDISNAECIEPESTDVGTTYTCVADVANIGEVAFEVAIGEDDSYVVRILAFDAPAYDLMA